MHIGVGFPGRSDIVGRTAIQIETNLRERGCTKTNGLGRSKKEYK